MIRVSIFCLELEFTKFNFHLELKFSKLKEVEFAKFGFHLELMLQKG